MKFGHVSIFILSIFLVPIRTQIQFNNYENFIQFKSQTLANYNDALCQNQLTQFSNALLEDQDWAVRLFDTWAKIKSGYLNGNTVNLGDFDSCVRFRNEQIQGQHCWVTVSAFPNSTLENNSTDINLKRFANFLRNNNINSLQNGFCLPASCSTTNVVNFLNQNFLLSNDLIAHNAECRTNDLPSLEALDYFAIVIFSFIALLMIASTIYDVVMKDKDKPVNKLFISFSVYTNGAKLFDMTKIKSENSLNCLHGLRAMSVLWIILGHRFGYQYPWGNFNDLAEFQKTLLGAIVDGYLLAVDTFFVMGSLLITWSTLKECEKGNLNIPRMIWKRYLRYTPVYAALILCVICFSKYIFAGPYVLDYFKENCVKYWWMALLHIQNYLPDSKMCLNHGWYLGVDFQLFLISPFIILLIHKFGKKLLAIPFILCLAAIIYTITISFIFEVRTLNQEIGIGSPGFRIYIRWIYYQTPPRAGPWFIGIILGYFLYTNRGKTIKINKWINALMWILSLSALISAVLSQYALFISTNSSNAAHSFAIGLHRNIWALGLCWIIFACQNVKTGGFIRWFLSLPQWQPISRMGLSMYIIGAVYQLYMTMNQRVHLYVNFWSMFPIIWSDIVAISILGTISYLAFEAPPMIIENYFYKKYQNSKKIVKKSTNF